MKTPNEIYLHLKENPLEITWSEIEERDYINAKYIRADLVEQQPAEWNEEDEGALSYLHELISFGVDKNFFDTQTAADMRNWLNIRVGYPRPSWKPSEEQIKALRLVLTYKWYDMIEAGEKPEEYRDLTKFYRSRIEGRDYDIVTFYRGYAKDRKTMSFKYGGYRVGTGQEKWGAAPGKQYYVIKLGERL